MTRLNEHRGFVAARCARRRSAPRARRSAPPVLDRRFAGEREQPCRRLERVDLGCRGGAPSLPGSTVPSSWLGDLVDDQLGGVADAGSRSSNDSVSSAGSRTGAHGVVASAAASQLRASSVGLSAAPAAAGGSGEPPRARTSSQRSPERGIRQRSDLHREDDRLGVRLHRCGGLDAAPDGRGSVGCCLCRPAPQLGARSPCSLRRRRRQAWRMSGWNGAWAQTQPGGRRKASAEGLSVVSLGGQRYGRRADESPSPFRAAKVTIG